MTKVVPLKMSDELYERLQDVAMKTGEADSTIIRLVLRAGLAQIKRDNYELFKFSEPPKCGPEFPAAAHAGTAPSDRRPTSSAPHSINEEPGIPAPVAIVKTSEPRASRARKALRKMAERESRSGKPS